jgi:hypothetical protein
MFNRNRPTIGGEVLTSVSEGYVTFEHVNNEGSLIWKVTLPPSAAREVRDFLNTQNLGI